MGVVASGGSESTAGGYKYHAFTNAGTAGFVVTTGGNIEILVVAGGGAGGGGITLEEGELVEQFMRLPMQ